MESLDFLRKLGLGRYGVTAGTYASGKDLPAEFLMDDVYGAKKDLISRKDVAHVGGARQKSRGRMVFFRITVALAVLVLLFLMAAGGISLWLFGSLGLWGGNPLSHLPVCLQRTALLWRNNCFGAARPAGILYPGGCNGGNLIPFPQPLKTSHYNGDPGSRCPPILKKTGRDF